jgi:hypothetical protein
MSDFKYALGHVVLFSLIVLGVVMVVNSGSAMSCAAIADKMGKTHSYGFIQGCMVGDKDGKWVPLESLRTAN